MLPCRPSGTNVPAPAAAPQGPSAPLIEGQAAAQQVRLARVTGGAACNGDLAPPQFGLAEDAGVEMQDANLWAPSQSNTIPPWAVTTTLEGNLELSGADGETRPSSAWAAHLPAFNCQLSTVRPAHSSNDHASLASRAPPITLAAVVRYVLDVDETEIQRHVLEILESSKSQATQGQADVHTPRKHPARMLYCPQAYNSSQTEELPIPESELAIVLAVVCGPNAAALSASPPSAVHPPSEPVVAEDTGLWTEFETDSLGQACGGILLKLIMDLWLNAGPGNCYPLQLRLLRQALSSTRPDVRSRAFDILYNLSLHSALVLSPEELQAQDVMPLASPTSLASPQDRRRSSIEEEDSGKTPSSSRGGPDTGEGGSDTGHGIAEVPDHTQLQRWTRALLFQLVVDIVEMSEMSELVWQSALGCLLHLTTHSGHFVTAWVQHLPTQALSGLLRACVRFGWSQELYCHLLQLASLLLTQAEAGPPVLAGGDQGSQDEDSPADMGDEDGVTFSAAAVGFGGLEEVLYHFSRAPTPASRAGMVALLVQYLGPPGAAAHAQLVSALRALDLPSVALALQTALHCPRPGMAQDLSAALLEGQPGLEACRGLLCEFLVQLQALCLQSMGSGLADELSAPIEATLRHISSDSSPTVLHPKAAAAAWAAFAKVVLTKESEARQVAIHWLHQWECALSGALLLVVRDAPLGCELLLASMLRVVADLRVQFSSQGQFSSAAHPVMSSYHLTLQWILMARESNSILPTILDLTDLVLTAMSEPYEPSTPAPFNPRLSLLDPSSLTSYATTVPNSLRASTQAANNIGSAHPDSNGASLAFSLPPLHPAHDGMFTTDSAYGHAHHPPVPEHARSASGSAIPSHRSKPALPAHLQAPHALSSPLSLGRDGAVRVGGRAAKQAPTAAAGAGCAGSTAAAQHISTCLIEGTSAFSPEVVASTPPELLVLLLQQCSDSTSSLGYSTMSRGFNGRPCSFTDTPSPAFPASHAQQTSTRGNAPGPPNHTDPHARGSAQSPGHSSSSSKLAAASQLAGSQVRGWSSGQSTVDVDMAAMMQAVGPQPARAGIYDGPWQDVYQDRRLAVMLALMARCALDPEAFALYNLSEVINKQLSCEDMRGRYYAAAVANQQPAVAKQSPIIMNSQVLHSILPARLEIVRGMDQHIRDHVQPLLKPVDKCWQASDFLPASQDPDFLDKVHDLRQRALLLPDDYLVVFVGDMVTEEALPTYMSMLNTLDGVRDETGASQTPWAVWTREWTAEENRHGDVMNRYMYLTGRVNMRAIEVTIQNLIGSGMDPKTENNPYLGFIYTAFQERATKISHGATARHALEHGDDVLARICGSIASDEGRHELAYSKIVDGLFERDPSGSMLAFADMMRKQIVMPAHMMNDNEHATRNGSDRNLFAAAAAQEYLVKLPERILKLAERAGARKVAKAKTANATHATFSWIFGREVSLI
ncbi:MAG: hypothetical protein WDW36_003044 [Sanguina aurantia]